MILTIEEIRLILGEFEWETVYDSGHRRVQKKTGGYSDTAEISHIQAKLSVMLEAKQRVADLEEEEADYT